MVLVVKNPPVNETNKQYTVNQLYSNTILKNIKKKKKVFQPEKSHESKTKDERKESLGCGWGVHIDGSGRDRYQEKGSGSSCGICKCLGG